MSALNDPRVLFAAERTLLAWNRTSLSLIAFGFVIERSGLLLAAATGVQIDPLSEPLTLWLGLLFIALGIYAAVHAALQFRAVLRTLQPAEFPSGYSTRGGVVLNVLVAVLGTALALGLFAIRH